MKYLGLTITELHQLLVEGKVTPLELVQEALSVAKENKYNAIETPMDQSALETARGMTTPTDDPLWGIPFAVKDNFSTKGIETTASSNILNGYVPLFDATAVRKLKEHGAIPIAKVSLDELAMGGTGTTGHKGITYNPWDPSHKHMIGGSSSGSAALVSSGIVPFALGSDTGDSVRKPASYAGLVGYKPTWGRISRYGLFPFAPSIDHVGYFSRSVEDSSILLSVLSGRDEMDSTSSPKPVEDYRSYIHQGVNGMKIAIIKEIYDSITDPAIRASFDASLKDLESKGAIIDVVSVDERLLKAIYPTYIVISSAEAGSNNACLDGIKYGPRKDGSTYEQVMSNARTSGFSELIKRRFVIGSFALLRENQDVLFLRAQKARRLIVDAFNKVFEGHDAFYLPSAPTVAPVFSSESERLSDEFLIADNHLAIGNLGGYPSLTVPLGFEDGLPFGGTITAKPFDDGKVFAIGQSIEDHTGLRNIVAGGERK